MATQDTVTPTAQEYNDWAVRCVTMARSEGPDLYPFRDGWTELVRLLTHAATLTAQLAERDTALAELRFVREESASWRRVLEQTTRERDEALATIESYLADRMVDGCGFCEDTEAKLKTAERSITDLTQRLDEARCQIGDLRVAKEAL